MSETACFHKPTEQNMEKAPQVQAFYTAGKNGSSNTWKITNDWHTHTHTKESGFSSGRQNKSTHIQKKQVIKHPLLSMFSFLNAMFSQKL